MNHQTELPVPSIEGLAPLLPQLEIERFVAQGAIGAVFRAVQRSVDRPVALKILRDEYSQDPALRERFTLEAKAMANLHHRNLVQLYDFGEADGILWMTQEWVDGITVWQVLQNEGSLQPDEAAALLAQACAGLDYAHRHGIVHRDVKPENMMEDEEGIVKLMDFGLARALQGGPRGLQSPGGTRYATEEYAAPELWDLDAVIDHRVDIFALGVLLYEALTGSRPTGSFRPPSEVRPGLDPRFDAIVVRAMQRNPADRFQDCDEFLRALREVAAGSAAPAAPRESAPGPLAGVPNSRAGRGTGKLVMAGLAALLAVGGGFGFFWSTQAGDESAAGNAPPGQQPNPPTVVKIAAAPMTPPAGGSPPKATPPPEPPADPPVASVEQPPPVEKHDQAPTAPRDEDQKPAKTEPATVSVADRLAKLDEQLAAHGAATLRAYEDARDQGLARYIESCKNHEETAVQNSRFFETLFWYTERQTMERGDEPPQRHTDIPEAAIAMRRDWHQRMNPVRKPLEKLQAAYLEDCRALLPESPAALGKAAVQARIDLVAEFPQFLVLCRGGVPVSGEDRKAAAPLDPSLAGLPPQLQRAHLMVSAKLAAYSGEGAMDRMRTLITSYGKALTRREKKVAEEGNAGELKAVRVAKNEMRARLDALDEDPLPTRPTGASSLALVANGKPTATCSWNRRAWRQHNASVENSANEARLTAQKEIGPGDFEVRLDLAIERIGATGAGIALGETVIELDAKEGVTMVEGGASTTSISGKKLPALASSGEFFTCILKRSGTSFQVVVNGKEGLQASIHDRALGVPSLLSAGATIQVREFTIVGTLRDPLEFQVLARQREPLANKGMTQIVPMEDQQLACFFVACRGTEEAEIWMRRSRNAGRKWEDPEPLVTPKETGHHKAWSFATTTNMKQSEAWLLYADGDANQRVFTRHGRNHGRSWGKPQEITAAAKERGWNLTVAGDSLTLARTSEFRGRMIVPILAGLDQEDLFVLLSTDGSQWRRVGPVIPHAGRLAEIIEDEAGRVWVATGAAPGHRKSGMRRWASSNDGGESWSTPHDCTLPDTSKWGGCLAAGTDHAGKPVWYYAMTEARISAELPPQTNLTLFGSRDAGKTWQRLRRFHYGRGFYPSVVPLGPGSCGIAFVRQTDGGLSEQVRFVELRRLWATR